MIRLICGSLHPELGDDLISRLVRFSDTLEERVVKRKLWGQSGAPWEFNLRDLLRSGTIANTIQLFETNESVFKK